ncbi:HAMP domain-containing protein [Mycobacterium sp. TNTM28]|uniref:HAMP domain-containing protein n=2 Tax=[Mycobacterium] fortunisiensis TaxID=2600579 RepID=A0ABS6KNT7_9MYCO|nr:adenylate/guanylate cyclase domain-containing protein [[Mycobacterium] fortunisiensis]MBU9765238.1 HAMP domain-containing protein [[Mycobacterium] fortunisiensis]
MLLLTSMLSAAVVGVIGYQSGRSSLRDSVFDRLTEIRAAQARQLESEYRYLRNSLVVYTRGATAAEATEAFTTAFDQLGKEPVTPEQHKAVADYYRKRFSRSTDTASGNQINVAALIPTSNAQLHLQAAYTAPFDDPAKAIKVDDAHDGSAWSAANARFNDYFRTVVTRFGFEEAMLLDTRGNVVYNAYKGPDLGTNINTGPYKSTQLTKAYEEALESNALDYVGVTDFSDYLPANGPTAWMVAPIRVGDRVAGVLALQFPIRGVNRIMTAGGKWDQVGMGKTGESYLVGPDGLMRSNSRLFVEDPQRFEDEVVEAGTSPDVAEKSIRQGGTTMVQPVANQASRLAQRGQSGTLVETDYLGNETLTSYAPVQLPGLDWVVVAKIDTAEAFAPVTVFTRTLVLSTVAIILVVCVAAILLARFFVRPLRRLEAGAHQISSGELGVSLPVLSRDEFGDLTIAFNEMSRNLRIKEDLLEEQRHENDRLLLSMMPEPVVQRYRDGEENIAQDHQNVTVVFADFLGLDELSAHLCADDLLVMVNNLIREFDAAAESLGVEPVRTLHNGYLASCGLTVPRLDNIRRTVDFAIEMQRIVDRYRNESGYDVRLRAGIDTGTVGSGLIGRSNLAYDMWGAAVDLAYQVQSGAPQAGVYVTDRVREATQDSRQFTAVGSVTVNDVEVPIWRLADRQS